MIVRRIARPMLASVFIMGGIGSIRYAKNRVETAAPIVQKIAAPLGLPEDTELLVKAHGATMVAGGALLATGKAPRLASLMLMGALAPATAAHDFWNENDPGSKAAEQAAFFKNISLLGGLLLAAVDTEGKPGLAYRAKLAGQNVERSARSAQQAARREAKLAALQAQSAVR